MSVPHHDISPRGSAPAASVKPFQIRGRYFTAVALRPEDGPLDQAFYAALDAQLRWSPHFFDGAPLILDLAQAPGLSRPAEIRALADSLRSRDLAVFGVQNATPAQAAAAQDAGLILLASGKDAPLNTGPGTRREPPRKLRPPENVLINRPVRSGQTVVAEGGDLVVVGPVSSGAELIARGSIHVYGRLRGRAMAGAEGDESARIFCHSLDAELLAVAGLYRTSENLEPELLNRPVQVFLQDGRLCVEALG
ncbi:septum site-determining protein MinC [Leisingera daeponensis]|uniref:Probable septum site-determining protein MinC n=1 Tax=Leisingera daeponensis TaxID=405746 RepID=A0ABS7N9X3_9RHOB|nr:septum site-determining protein MinC [Leisingera daeponensis]MBY6055007.1 septum site-determining protein MinC [Leisingera daeponensis]MBY6138002.1 septum site-determining protein MinC [Leisingera daeponensis]